MTTDTTPTSPTPVRKAAMPFIMVTVLIDMIGLGLIIPVLPLLVGTFTHSPAEQTYWSSATMLAFSFANFFSSPVLGGLSDRFGRRPVLLIGFCAFALSFFVTALATDLWMLIGIRLISGSLQANQSVANAYVADISSPDQRAKRFGMLGAMFGLGFILGPVLGGILGERNVHLPFFVAGSLALVNFAYGYFVLPESLPKERRQPFGAKSFNPFASLVHLSQLKGVGLLVAVICFSGLAQFILYTSLVLYGKFKFGWGPAQTSWFMATVGLTSVFVQGFLLNKLLKRYSPQRLAVVGLISSTIGYFAYGAATEGWMMLVIVVANMLGFVVQASMQSIISNAASAKTQGQTMGAVGALNSLMAILGPMVGAPLLAHVSHFPEGDWHIGLPFYFCSFLQGMGLLFAVIHFRRVRRDRVALEAQPA